MRVELGGFRLDVEVSGGTEATVVVGVNGSGKSTLLRALAGGLELAEGRIEVGGALWSEGGAGQPPEARRVGYVPQGSGLFPHASVLDNVAFGVRARSKRERRERARSALDAAEAGALADRPASTLSGGQAQRVALIRALVTEPSMLLLDEPLSAVDLGARGPLRQLLAEQSRRRPVVVVTHDPKDIRVLDARVVVLEAGRVIQAGRPEVLARAPANGLVRELFEGWV